MIVRILPNVSAFNLYRAVNSVISAHFAHRRVEGQPSKKPKKDGDKSAVANDS